MNPRGSRTGDEEIWADRRVTLDDYFGPGSELLKVDTDGSDVEVLLGVLVEGGVWRMIEYPFVLDTVRGRCMLYNGNQYGQNGIGVATTGTWE